LTQKQQIPFRNDRKKGEGKGKDNGKGKGKGKNKGKGKEQRQKQGQRPPQVLRLRCASLRMTAFS
jgi:hypothetical protein